MRADAGFFSYDMIAAIERPQGASYSITIPQNAKVKAAIAAIGDNDWASRSNTPAAARRKSLRAPSTAGRRGDKLPGRGGKPAKLRLIVRRTRLLRRPTRTVAQLAPPLRSSPTEHDLDTCRRRHLPPSPRHRGARHQRPQRERRAQPLPLRTVPRQRRLARLLRARAQPRCAGPPASAAPTPQRRLTVAATIRNRLLAVPARLVNHSGRRKLRLPLNWPWAHTFTTALQRIRNLPLLV